MSVQTAPVETSVPAPEPISTVPDTISVQELAAKIDHIAVLLAELKAQVQTLIVSQAKNKTKRDWFGAFPHMGDVSWEDFQEAKIKMNWDKFKDI